MKLELKSFKHAVFASEETLCFNANLYADGKPVAIVSNDGHGGCNNIYVHPKSTKERLAEVEDYCKSLPPEETEFKNKDGSTWFIDQDLEYVVSGLANKHVADKFVRAVLKKIAVVDGGKLYTYNKKASELERFRKGILDGRPNAVFLGDLTYDEAFKLVHECA